MARRTHREYCPDCDRPINDGTGHEEGCFYEGVDAYDIEEMRESWAAEARFEARREKEAGF